MIVSVVGPRQSGSTLLFNLARLILATKDKSYDTCWIQTYNMGMYNKEADYLIVKCHDFNVKLLESSTIILLPLRDVRDCAVSYHKRFKTLRSFSDILGYIMDNVKQFNDWEPHADFIFRYEDYVENKELHIMELAKVLGVHVDTKDIGYILTEIDNLHKGGACPLTDGNITDTQRIDMLVTDPVYKTTMMTKSHNTSNGAIGKYKKEMPQPVINKINMKPTINSFLLKHGYNLH